MAPQPSVGTNRPIYRTQRMMAKKEGFTKFPNEMLETMYGSRLSSLEYALILVAVRKIIGWHKPTETGRISLSQFCKLTGRTKRAVQKALKKLDEQEVLIRAIPGTGKRSTVWAINTDYDSWRSAGVNERSTQENEKGVNERSTLRVEKEAENEAETDASDAKGEQPFHPGVKERSTLEVRRGEQPFTHKRKRSKETIAQESENSRSRALINLIKDQLREVTEDKAFDLSNTYVDAIQTVSEKFPNDTLESLLHTFRLVLGTYDDPLAAISHWTENVGGYLPTSKRQEKGLTSVQSNLAAFGKR